MPAVGSLLAHVAAAAAAAAAASNTHADESSVAGEFPKAPGLAAAARVMNPLAPSSYMAHSAGDIDRRNARQCHTAACSRVAVC